MDVEVFGNASHIHDLDNSRNQYIPLRNDLSSSPENPRFALPSPPPSASSSDQGLFSLTNEQSAIISESTVMILRIIAICIEGGMALGAIAISLMSVTTYWNIDYTVISTYIAVKDTSITYDNVYTYVMEYFLFKTTAINATGGLIITNSNFSVLNADKACQSYEYYINAEDALAAYNYLRNYYFIFTLALGGLALVGLTVLRAMFYRILLKREIPLLCKFVFKIKLNIEVVSHFFINFVAAGIAGMSFPLYIVNGVGNCLCTYYSDVNVKSAFEYEYMITMFIICFSVPLILYGVYTFIGDKLNFICFTFMAIQSPLILYMSVTGFYCMFLVIIYSPSTMAALVYGLNIAIVAVNLILAISFSLYITLIYEKLAQIEEKKQLEGAREYKESNPNKKKIEKIKSSLS